MPNNIDLTGYKFEEITVNPKSWNGPLKIELCDVWSGDHAFTYWRIKDTAHVFTILTDYLESLGYESIHEHIEEILKTFRDDYKQWHNGGLNEPWMWEYKEMFEKLIKI